METKVIKRIALLLIVSPAAFGGLRVVEKHEGWQLTVGSKVYTGKDWTYEDCKNALGAFGTGATGKCKDSYALVIETTCDDEPKPEWKTVVNAEGFVEQPGIVIGEKPDGTWGPTMQEGFVQPPNPKWPNCWVPGLVPYDGKYRAPDGPASQEAGPWTFCVDYGSIAHPPVGKACPDKAPAGCFIPKNAPDVCPP